MLSAFRSLDPFSVALWTLVACAFVFMLYVTLALGRFIKGVDDLRQRSEELTSELCSAAKAFREALADGRIGSELPSDRGRSTGAGQERTTP